MIEKFKIVKLDGYHHYYNTDSKLQNFQVRLKNRQLKESVSRTKEKVGIIN